MKRRHRMPFGSEVKADGTTEFRLWAPDAKSVELCLNTNGLERCLPTESDQYGWRSLVTDQASAGDLYCYLINGEQRVPDPASRFQPQGVHGPSQIVDPTQADWRDSNWHGRPWEEAVIYELHTGTFSASGDYQGIEKRLDYLADLGVTAVELMPLSAFPGKRNWGYDGVLPFAPSQCYGTPDELKRLIQAAHERELMVLLDVVYNHFGPDGNYLHLYASDFFTPRHQTPWGDGINFDDQHSDIVRQFFIHNALYWLEEYHFDGLRLDAVHAIADDSRPDILEELACSVQEGPGRDRLIHLILENDDNAAHYLDTSSNEGRQAYTAQWNDDIHHSLHALVTGEADGYYGDYASNRAGYLGRCLSEGFAWQGEESPYRDHRPRGEVSGHLPPTAFVSFLQNHDQVGNRALGERIDAISDPAAIIATLPVRLLAPSPPLLFMGEEFAAATPFQFFCDFEGELGTAVTEGRRKEFAHFESFNSSSNEDQIPDPNDPSTFEASKLDWNSLDHSNHNKRLQLCKELLTLRQEAIVPGLAGMASVSSSYEQVGPNAVHVNWRLRDGSRLDMLFNLGADPCPTVTEDCPEFSTMIYCVPETLIEDFPNSGLPPWSAAVFLDGGSATSDSRHSTITALQSKVAGTHDRSRRPSAKASQSLSEKNPSLEESASIPDATYRLQLHRDFNFRDARKIIPYLQRLGISHCYCSPYLKARPGSTHGYNITDHTTLNPELGGEEEFDRFVTSLREANMGHILDMVPNHMGIMGRDNAWWLDVLENGPASRYGQFFDIDWTPLRPGMRDIVLLPVLGDHYGNVLDNGELSLSFDAQRGSFAVEYYEHLFPIDPQQYPYIFKDQDNALAGSWKQGDEVTLEFQSLLTAFENLPSRDSTSDQDLQDRKRDKELLKQRLASLCEESPPIKEFILTRVDAHNGTDKAPGNAENLHQLLERQAYRLAHWRVASDEINYRRFFDINDLACLRMEDPDVFEETHRTTLDLIAQEKIQGLRIDHPDGLYNPAEYFQRLQDRVGARTKQPWSRKPLYLLAEKILSRDEPLRQDWSLHGTTGYEFAGLCTGLFVDSRHADSMQTIYETFVGKSMDLNDIIYRCKKLIMETSLASEVAVLANQLNRISEADPHTRDFTLNGLRQALIEIVACFPVYRTYITQDSISPEDERYINQAISNGARRSQAADISAFGFIRDVLLQKIGTDKSQEFQDRIRRFAMQFQQYCAPVMAKGVEDTTFYVYNRLVALNEVGSDPGKFGVGVAEFHQANRTRLEHWPHSLTALSTHDSKRSADVRARIGILSEIPHLWQKHVLHWQAVNRVHKNKRDDWHWPDNNLEYLFYQTLIGAWPQQDLDNLDLEAFRERIQAYMLKAAKEAKQYTSWINSNSEYEDDLKQFIDKVLTWDNRDFLDDFARFQSPVSEFGFIVSLAQELIRLTAPGVPDTYQGDEMWNFSLVDPDNRRPVNYEAHVDVLDQICDHAQKSHPDPSWIQGLTEHMADGRSKCYLIWKVLSFRHKHRDLFRHGEYLALDTTGNRADNVCAFARRHRNHTILVVVPRLLAGVAELTDFSVRSLGEGDFWGNTNVILPTTAKEGSKDTYTNIITGKELRPNNTSESLGISVSSLLRDFPVALLSQNEN
ncbi:malto-oligosyltrehalose synthase [Marinimicrobium sp. ABcell2]|uniref:malto-oligosyltrehalose synthase n=1 Tax=Marinimicrobium sp. ABcell2 TaxID=3069751 RepID=UPI0027B2AD0E|nr:malto-oligosyltrehalose synthase [Marinimicrobium sp. ABcell2]MDQ2075306.1 malto-oligosyltrehalose synthase [Marinimicrobium sp. ABcell2]